MDASALDSALALSLTLSLPGDKPARSGSVAVSKTGALYAAGSVASETHLLDIPSELAALVRALYDNETAITQMHTLTTDTNAVISPLVLKILADHSVRTGITIQYRVRDLSGNTLYQINDARAALPFYKIPNSPLSSLGKRTSRSGKEKLESIPGMSPEMQLRKWALAGCERNFPTRDGASGYGSAVLTASGVIYYGGQYSSFEKRLNVHAEMGVLLHALMDGVHDITHIGIASSKFKNTPCSPCGCCRQFLGEFSRTYNFSPTLYLFASDNEQYVSHTIEELLPVQWTSKQ